MHNNSWGHKYFFKAHPISSTEKKNYLYNQSYCSINFFGPKSLELALATYCFLFRYPRWECLSKKQHVSDYQQELPELKTGTPRRPHVRDQTGDFPPDSSPRRLILSFQVEEDFQAGIFAKFHLFHSSEFKINLCGTWLFHFEHY